MYCTYIVYMDLDIMFHTPSNVELHAILHILIKHPFLSRTQDFVMKGGNTHTPNCRPRDMKYKFLFWKMGLWGYKIKIKHDSHIFSVTCTIYLCTSAEFEKKSFLFFNMFIFRRGSGGGPRLLTPKGSRYMTLFQFQIQDFRIKTI